MNALETRNFIDKVKKGLTKEYVTELVDAYLLSERAANTLNAFDNLVADDSLVSFPDRRICERIISKLLGQHVAAGGDTQSFTTIMKSNPARISFNAREIAKSGERTERTNKFGISVSGTNLFAVLDELIAKAEEAGYEYDIDIPIMRETSQGIIDTINLYCSTEDLEKTINFINSLGEELTAKFSPNPSKAMHFTPSISYDAFDTETQKWGKGVIGESLVAAIDTVISSAVQQATIPVTIEDANYYNNEHDMTASYLYMKDKFEVAKLDFYQLVTDFLKDKLKSLEFDLSNIYMSKAFLKRLYIINHAAPQVTSPSGFVANQVIKAKPAEVTFEQQEQEVKEEKHILGEDDIPDLPEGFVPLAAQQPAATSTSLGASTVPAPTPASPILNTQSAPEVKNEFIKGPTMMLIPEMLERHHTDADIEGLYQAFMQIKNDEMKISSKIMQLNQFWPDLTYADFVAFRQFDRAGDFIPDGFIELWVNTKQGEKKDQVANVSSEELYKPKAEVVDSVHPVAEPEVEEEKKEEQTVPPVSPVPEPPITNLTPPPVQVPPTESVDTEKNDNTLKAEGETPVAPEVPPVPAPAPAPRPNNSRTSKTARVMELIARGPRPLQEEPEPAPAPAAVPEPAPVPEKTVTNPGFVEPVQPAAPGEQVLGDGTNNNQTGVYNDTPVKVEPLDGQSLTPGEAEAMVGVGNNQNNTVDLAKYSFFPNAEVALSQPVVDLDGATITLYNYLEKYNILSAIPIDATIETPDGVMTAQDFIVNNLARYVVTNGAIGVEEYMELFNTHMTPKDSEKKGLLSKILGNRKG